MNLLQIQPSRHSCLVTSFAMVLRIKVNELMKMVGHDGSDIIDSLEPEPKCRRSFHIQELIDISNKLNYNVICIESIPSLQLYKSIYQIWDLDKCMKRIDDYLQRNDGVLLNDNHAVAWIKGLVYDPCGEIYSIDKFAFHTFYIVRR